MKPENSTRFAALVTCALLSGCAGSVVRYPSLAVRDVERAQGQFAPVDAPERAPVSPVASADDLSALVIRASQSHTRFIETRPAVRQLVSAARGQGIDSNARQLALVALADLTALHSDTAIPMNDLDLLKAKAATSFAPVEAIDIARAAVAQLLAEQERELDSLASEVAQ